MLNAKIDPRVCADCIRAQPAVFRLCTAHAVEQYGFDGRLPAYSDSAYVEIDGNQPSFTDADKQETEAFEEYSDLDYLGRCGTHTPMSDRS